MIWLWRTEICKINLVWWEFWNCEMWTFLTLWLDLIESMIRAICGPICKTTMIQLTPIVSRLKSKWYKLQTNKKLALNSQLETYQILRNDDQMLIFCLSYFVTTEFSGTLGLEIFHFYTRMATGQIREELHNICRICDHSVISSKWPFLHSGMPF